MKQSLNLKLQNKLNLTLSLKTQINLLTLSKTDLIQEIQQELQENPFLEEIVNIQMDYNPDLKEIAIEEEDAEINPLARIPYRQSLMDIIENQINLEFEGIDRDIAFEIVDEIDEKGFFKENLEKLAKKYNKSVKYIDSIRKKITTLEPTGLASLNLQEFFLLQLEESGDYDLVVESIILDDIDRVNDIDYLSKKYNLSREEIEQKLEIIKHFRPYPLYGYEDIQIQYIEPDIFVYIKSQPKEGDYFEVVIDESDIPNLNIVSSYRKILSKRISHLRLRNF